MTLGEEDWKTLLDRIDEGTCTPFLGAAANDGNLPLGMDIAHAWADEFEYPLESRSDLSKVAQFIAVRTDPARPKELIVQKLSKELRTLDYDDEYHPINVLAKLPCHVYLTTNYDELLQNAIDEHGKLSGRKASSEICKWNNSKGFPPSLFRRGSKFAAGRQTPVIYHLHGRHSFVDSIVLTEDDYLDYLVNMSKSDKRNFLPPRIQEAITTASVMFVGYSLTDVNFRVILRGLKGNLDNALRRMSVSVQLPYDPGNPNKQKAEEYVTKYFRNLERVDVRVYWGTAREFSTDLWNRWKNRD